MIGNRPRRKMAVINLFTRSEGPSSPQHGQLIKFCQVEVFSGLADWYQSLVTGLFRLACRPDIMLLNSVDDLCMKWIYLTLISYLKCKVQVVGNWTPHLHHKENVLAKADGEVLPRSITTVLPRKEGCCLRTYAAFDEGYLGSAKSVNITDTGFRHCSHSKEHDQFSKLHSHMS